MYFVWINNNNQFQKRYKINNRPIAHPSMPFLLHHNDNQPRMRSNNDQSCHQAFFWTSNKAWVCSHPYRLSLPKYPISYQHCLCKSKQSWLLVCQGSLDIWVEKSWLVRLIYKSWKTVCSLFDWKIKWLPFCFCMNHFRFMHAYAIFCIACQKASL